MKEARRNIEDKGKNFRNFRSMLEKDETNARKKAPTPTPCYYQHVYNRVAYDIK